MPIQRLAIVAQLRGANGQVQMAHIERYQVPSDLEGTWYLSDLSDLLGEDIRHGLHTQRA